MFRKSRSRSRQASTRQGAIIVVMLFMLPVLLIFSAITINYAYMQLVQTELRVASDMAAMAGAESLGRTQNSTQAINAAILQASRNKVAGVGLTLNSQNIKLGQAVPTDNGRWQYKDVAGSTATGSVFNAISIDATTGGSSAHPAINLFFGSFLGQNQFSPKTNSKSGHRYAEICLCLDRSGSMGYDMSGIEYSYPSPLPNQSDFVLWGEVWQNMLSPPHPSLSRWSQLRTAINAFLEEVDTLGMKPRISLVTWASDYYLPIPFDENIVGTTVNHSIDEGSTFVIQRSQILSKLDTLGSQKMVGATNVSNGLHRAIDHITGPQTKPFTNKVIILFTDGVWNEGQHPGIPAARAKAAGVVVHTITLLSGTAYSDMQAVANETDGMAFNVASGSQLRNAFRQIAKNIGVTLIE